MNKKGLTRSISAVSQSCLFVLLSCLCSDFFESLRYEVFYLDSTLVFARSCTNGNCAVVLFSFRVDGKIDGNTDTINSEELLNLEVTETSVSFAKAGEEGRKNISLTVKNDTNVNIAYSFGLSADNNSLTESQFSVLTGAVLVYFDGNFEGTLSSLIQNGEKIFDNPKVKSRIAYLGDTPYFMQNATIKETADFYRRLYPRFDNTLYNRLLEVFPLDYKAKISTMSKGMQRQAALINAIASSPDYLLLDEAFDGLDVVIRKALKGILVDGVTARGMTTVIASHNLRELEDLCDSVGLVHNGHMVLSDEVDKLKGNLHKVQAAFRGVPDVTAFSGLDVIKAERSGSLLQLIVRGDEIQIMNYINRLSPVFSECIEPSLEETFMFELEVNGYDVKSIAE